MAATFLQKMRKSELIELCDSVGYTDYEGQKKTDIEVGLDEYLVANATTYSSDPKLAQFYKTKRGFESPMKKETSLIEQVETKAKAVKRRVTKAAEDFLPTTDDSEAEPATTRARSAQLTRTPRASALSFASSVPLPPSPAVVADAIDRRTQALRTKVSKVYKQSGLTESAESTRELLSNILTVQAATVLFEIYNLRKELLADRYAFTVPAISLLHTDKHEIMIPDLFLLLTSSFWGPVLLWSITTFFVPLIAAYFVNLTAKPSRSRSHGAHFTYAFDPLTFSIVKALLTYVVFGQDVTFGGLVDLEYVARINSALYGGYQGVLVGTGITSLVTLYEAVLRK